MNRLFVVFILLFCAKVSLLASYSSDVVEYAKGLEYISPSKRNKFELVDFGFGGNAQASKKYLAINERLQMDESMAVAAAPDSSFSADEIRKLKEDFDNVKNNRLFLAAMNGKTMSLPFGINKSVGGIEYVIVVNEIVLKQDGAYATVSTIIDDPKEGGRLAFALKNVKLNRDGGFSVNGGELVLIEDYTMHFGGSEVIFNKNRNSVVFDCNGFQSLNLSANVEILPGIIGVEENRELKPSTQGRYRYEVVRGSVDLENVTDLGDWVVALTVDDPFQFVDLPGFSFSLDSAALDMSPSANYSGMVLQGGAEKGPEWEGFYLRRMSVTLPERIESRADDADATVIRVDNAYIDRMGFTGAIIGENIIPNVEAGSLDGWAYSLTDLGVYFENGGLHGASFGGQIKVPVSGENELFDYNATIMVGGSCAFTIETVDSMSFNIWNAAKASLYEDSRLTVEYDTATDSFKAEAVLNGKVDITAGDFDANLAEITFQGLHIASRNENGKGHFFLDERNGAFSVGSPAAKKAMSGFPITISEIGLSRHDTLTGLDFTINLNLTGNDDADGGFAASGDFTLLFSTGSRWAYEDAQINRLAIDNAKIAVLTLSGEIVFLRNDSIYGNGFRGNLSCDIEITGGTIGLDMAAIFGRKDSTATTDAYRYWAVDGTVSFDAKPIEIYPPFIYLNKFGGGMTYHMQANPTASKSGGYVSTTGMVYEPTNDVGLGLSSSVGIQAAKSEVYNGDINFLIVFSQGSIGIEQINLNGFVQFLTPPDAITEIAESVKKYKDAAAEYIPGQQVEEPSEDEQNNATKAELARLKRDADGAVVAQWFINYDVDARTFMGNFATYINVANGAIKGVNEGGHAGAVDILISPDEWHLYIGTPVEPMGLDLVGLAQAKAYFVVGNNLSDVGLASKYPALQSEPSKGFGFGAEFRLGASGSGGGFFYNVSFGVGFDILLMNVKDKVCRESGKPFGVNNWFAMGHAFIEGNLEAGVDLKFKYPVLRCCVKVRTKTAHIKESFSCSLGERIAFAAPNPTRVEYNREVLGYDINLAFGEKCSF